MKQLLVFALSLAALSLPADSAEKTLADYKAVYDNESQGIEIAYQGRLSRALVGYGENLGKIRERFKKAGDLTGILAWKKEQERFQKEDNVPDEPPVALPPLIRTAQSLYHQSLSKAKVEKDKKLKVLTDSYLRRLAVMKKELVTQDKLDEAVAVHSEMKRVELVIADAELRLLAPEEKPGGQPHVVASSKPIGKLSADLTRGLVLYYDFDKDEGERVSDLGGKGNHGNVHGATWTREGVGAGRTARGGGGAYQFDGKASRIVCPSGLFLGSASAVTISLWVKSSSLTGSSQGLLSKIYGKRPYWSMYVFKGGRQIKWEIGDQNSQSFVLPDHNVIAHGEWSHIVVCQEMRRAKMYLDGQLVQSSELETEFSASRNPNRLWIGCLEGGETESPGFSFLGLMDEVVIWDRALSEREIKQVYKLTGGK